jgi:hypothetical protein
MQRHQISSACTIEYLRVTKDAMLKMEKLLLVWIADQQAKGDTVNSTLIR